MATQPTHITFNVCGDDQSSSFMNATQQLRGAFSVSIAVHMPHDTDSHSQEAIAETLRSDFAPLIAKGYQLTVQIGEDEIGSA